MSGFDVMATDLQAAGAGLEQVERETTTELGRLVQQAESFLGSGWRGGAATGFETGWREWHDGATEVLRALRVLGQMLRGAGADYQLTEEDNAASFGRVREL